MKVYKGTDVFRTLNTNVTRKDLGKWLIWRKKLFFKSKICCAINTVVVL